MDVTNVWDPSVTILASVNHRPVALLLLGERARADSPALLRRPHPPIPSGVLFKIIIYRHKIAPSVRSFLGNDKCCCESFFLERDKEERQQHNDEEVAA